MLFFTDRGKCFWLKVYDIPQGGRATRGRAIVNLIGCDPTERVEAFVSVSEFKDDHFIVMATKKGVVKKNTHPPKVGSSRTNEKRGLIIILVF